MQGSLRRLRGMLGIGVTWGIVWGTIFAVLAAVVDLVDPGSIDPGEGPLVINRAGAVFGLVSGAVFGVLLSVAERGKAILDLSLGRAVLWGAVATAVYPRLPPVSNAMLIMLCPLGAGAVAMARKAERLSASPEQRRLAG